MYNQPNKCSPPKYSPGPWLPQTYLEQIRQEHLLFTKNPLCDIHPLPISNTLHYSVLPNQTVTPCSNSDNLTKQSPKNNILAFEAAIWLPNQKSKIYSLFYIHNSPRKPRVFCWSRPLPLHSLGFCDSECVVHMTSWVDIWCQGTIHWHTEHVTFLGNDRLTVNTAKICKLLKKEKEGDSGGMGEGMNFAAISKS